MNKLCITIPCSLDAHTPINLHKSWRVLFNSLLCLEHFIYSHSRHFQCESHKPQRTWKWKLINFFMLFFLLALPSNNFISLLHLVSIFNVVLKEIHRTCNLNGKRKHEKVFHSRCCSSCKLNLTLLLANTRIIVYVEIVNLQHHIFWMSRFKSSWPSPCWNFHLLPLSKSRTFWWRHTLVLGMASCVNIE